MANLRVVGSVNVELITYGFQGQSVRSLCFEESASFKRLSEVCQCQGSIVLKSAFSADVLMCWVMCFGGCPNASYVVFSVCPCTNCWPLYKVRCG